jgi:prepilin-type N-terminal cleavage/methylation domain-containing protein
MAGNRFKLGARLRGIRSGRRGGFTLIEVLMVALLLGICAAGVTQTWSFCYTMNDQTRRMQAGKDVMEQDMERVRRLNWTGLSEQTSWAAQYCYDAGGNPVRAYVDTTSPVTNGFVSHVKVETLNSNGLSINTTPTVDTSGGTSRSLRRVTIRVQPSGVSAATDPPTAEAVTFLTLGGP